MNIKSPVLTFIIAVGLLPLSVSCHHAPVPAPTRTIYVADSIIIQRGDTTLCTIVSDSSGPLYHIVESAPRVATHREMWVAFSGGLVLLVVLSFMFIIRLRRKNLQIGDLAEEIDAINRRSEHIARTVSCLLEDRVSMVQSLAERHSAVLSVSENDPYLTELEKLRNRVSHYDSYMRDLRRQDQFLGELEDALNASDQDIMKKLRGAFGSTLKEDDYRFIACVFAGIGNASIGFVTGLAPGAVRTRKSRYKVRLRSLPDSSDKELFLSVFEKGSM